MVKTGGIRVLLHSLSDGPLEMAPILTSAFLHIADSPRTRANLHPGTDLEASSVHYSRLGHSSFLIMFRPDGNVWRDRCLR